MRAPAPSSVHASLCLWPPPCPRVSIVSGLCGGARLACGCLHALQELIVDDLFHVTVPHHPVFDGKFAKKVPKVSSRVATVMFTILCLIRSCLFDYLEAACFSLVLDTVQPFSIRLCL